jgi:hypothetical protein
MEGFPHRGKIKNMGKKYKCARLQVFCMKGIPDTFYNSMDTRYTNKPGKIFLKAAKPLAAVASSLIEYTTRELKTF